MGVKNAITELNRKITLICKRRKNSKPRRIDGCLHVTPFITEQPTSSSVPDHDYDESPVRYTPNECAKYEEQMAKSVLDLPFRQVCDMLCQLDKPSDVALIEEMLLHFSLVVYGLPECKSEDLLLAVYFFIEDTFGVQSKIAFCERMNNPCQNAIGVVFETIRMKYEVLKMDSLLEGTEVRIKDNKDINLFFKKPDEQLVCEFDSTKPL